MKDCPGEDQLQAFCSGLSSKIQTESILAHVQVCGSCRDYVAELRTDEAILPQVEDVLKANAAAGLHSDAHARSSIGADSSALTKTQLGTDASTEEGRRTRHFPAIDGYKIIDVLGQGGMGIVYRAVQNKLDRPVALKVLPAVIGSISPTSVTRFRQEATAAARLHHTNIVPIYDFGESNDAYYYAMELISGKPLDDLIRLFQERNAISLSPIRFLELIQTALPNAAQAFSGSDERALDDSKEGSGTVRSSSGRGLVYDRLIARWMADAAGALHHAHSENIIHRDIKPANLIVAQDARIMIADFGLAKCTEGASVTITGALLGTIRYMSPEQAMAKRVRVDHQTDIFSLGATMYELLTLQPAFPGNDDKKILATIIQKNPIPPRKIRPSIPRELEIICLMALEKAPERRYATARTMEEDIRRYLNDLPILAKPPRWPRIVINFIKRHRTTVAASIALLSIIGLLLAIKANSTIVKANSAIARLRLEEQVHGLVSEALLAEESDQWDDASRLYEQALAINPKSAKVLGNFAGLRIKMFNSQENGDDMLLADALDLCNRALNINTSTSALWNVKGVVLKKLARFSDAREAYERAVDLEPENAAFVANFGLLAALDGDLATAEDILTRAAKLASEQGLAYCAIWQAVAQIQWVRQDAESLDSIRLAAACDPADAMIGLTEARILLELKRYHDPPRALDAAKAAIRMAGKTTPRAHRVLALAHLRNDDFEDSIHHANQASQGNDMTCVNCLVVAIAQSKLGNRNASNEARAAAMAAWPDDLKQPGSFRCSASKLTLWIESADALLALRDELDDLLTP